MPDAAQPYKNVNFVSFQKIFIEMFQNPEKNNMVVFKQTFMFLCQLLFFYRYRERAEQRDDAFACALCEGRDRHTHRSQAALTITQMALNQGMENVDMGRVAGLAAETVAYIFCSMSRGLHTN